MSVEDDLRNPNSLLYKCSRISTLIQRFYRNYPRKDKSDIVEKLCEENGITVKEWEDYEKEYWENVAKVMMGKPL